MEGRRETEVGKQKEAGSGGEQGLRGIMSSCHPFIGLAGHFVIFSGHGILPHLLDGLTVVR